MQIPGARNLGRKYARQSFRVLSGDGRVVEDARGMDHSAQGRQGAEGVLHLARKLFKIRDIGPLANFVGLRNLNLSETSVGDIAPLSELTNLKFLYLDKTNITDEGLVHLKGLTNLRILYLNNTKVTDEGVKKLQTSLPKCRISH